MGDLTAVEKIIKTTIYWLETLRYIYMVYTSEVFGVMAALLLMMVVWYIFQTCLLLIYISLLGDIDWIFVYISEVFGVMTDDSGLVYIWEVFAPYLHLVTRRHRLNMYIYFRGVWSDGSVNPDDGGLVYICIWIYGIYRHIYILL